MSFQDPPGRQRPSRYQALAQHEDGLSPYRGAHAASGAEQSYQDGYQGFAGLADTLRERPPWEDSLERGAWDGGEQQAARGGGAHRSRRNTGGLVSGRNTGGLVSGRNTGGLVSGPDTGGLPRRTSGAFLAVPDDGQDGAAAGTGGWRGRGRGRGGRRRSLGLLPGAMAGFLAAAVALGVANLVAAFVRPQASPIIAVGEAFIDRTPNALKEFAIQKFGENDKNMLLLGMYVTVALIAVVIGVLAWQRLWLGVAGIGLFGLFGAFVAITRPESRVTDVIPSIVGGIAGVAAIVLLVRAGMPRTRAAWARGR